MLYWEGRIRSFEEGGMARRVRGKSHKVVLERGRDLVGRVWE